MSQTALAVTVTGWVTHVTHKEVVGQDVQGVLAVGLDDGRKLHSTHSVPEQPQICPRSHLWIWGRELVKGGALGPPPLFQSRSLYFIYFTDWNPGDEFFFKTVFQG